MSEIMTKYLIPLANNPILTGSLPLNWTQPDFYPVPLSYFYNVHSPPLWNTSIRM